MRPAAAADHQWGSLMLFIGGSQRNVPGQMRRAHESFLPWQLLINYSEVLCAVSGLSLTLYYRFWIRVGGEAAVLL